MNCTFSHCKVTTTQWKNANEYGSSQDDEEFLAFGVALMCPTDPIVEPPTLIVDLTA